MPFDGTEAKFVKPEVFSLPALVAWLETQDPATEYVYISPRGCLMGLYTAAHGGTYDPGTARYTVDTCQLNAMPDFMGKFNGVAIGEPRTFGAALSRARRKNVSSLRASIAIARSRT